MICSVAHRSAQGAHLGEVVISTTKAGASPFSVALKSGGKSRVRGTRDSQACIAAGSATGWIAARRDASCETCCAPAGSTVSPPITIPGIPRRNRRGVLIAGLLVRRRSRGYVGGIGREQV